MNGIVLPGLFCLLSFGLFAEYPLGVPECKQTSREDNMFHHVKLVPAAGQ